MEPDRAGPSRRFCPRLHIDANVLELHMLIGRLIDFILLRGCSHPGLGRNSCIFRTENVEDPASRG